MNCRRAALWGTVLAMHGLFPLHVDGWASAQSVEVVVKGLVVDSADRPIAGASALCEPDVTDVPARAAADGRVLIRCGVDESKLWRIRVRAIGFAPRVVSVTAAELWAPEPVRWVLRPVIQDIGAVRVVAKRPRPPRDDLRTGRQPGANETALDVGAGMSGDLTGNPGAALVAVAALAAQAGGDGLRSVGAFGQQPDQNRATLNGVDFDGDLPRDGLRRAARLATYDPRVGRFSGIVVTATMPSGSSARMRSARASFEGGLPVTPWGELPPRRTVASLTASGPLRGPAKFANISLQLSRSPSDAYSLLSQPVGGASAFSLSAVALDALRRANRALGATVEPSSTLLTRTVHGASAIARIDFTRTGEFGAPNEGTLFYLLAHGSMRATSGVGLSPWVAWSRTLQSRSNASQTTLVWAPFIRHMLSEARLSYSVSTQYTAPTWQAPGVDVTSSDSMSSESGVATLGGAALGTSRTINRQWMSSYDLSWLTRDRRHRFNAFTDALLIAAEFDRSAQTSATWGFASLDALISRRADYFERADAQPPTRFNSLRGSVALSDVVTLNQRTRVTNADEGRGLVLQAGLRLDWSRRVRGAANDEVADARYGIRTGVVDAAAYLAPMVGFSWGTGVVVLSDDGATITDTRTKVSGGVRIYRNMLDLPSIESVLQTAAQETSRELRCTGAAAPLLPQGWSSSGQSVPSGCQPDAPIALSSSGRRITAQAPGYEPARSTRGELKVRHLLSAKLALLGGVAVSEGRANTEAVDRNLRMTPAFFIADEGGRPVYATASAIDGRSGRVSVGGSRVDANYTMVFERRSGLRTRFLQPTLGLMWRTRPGAALSPVSASSADLGGALSVSYAYNRGAAEVSGFVGPTGGDPRDVAWSRTSTPKHVLVIDVTTATDAAVRISASLRVTSGVRYTPMVATDVNGDGLPNDVAFIPPSLAVDEIMDARARRCISAQRGTMAALNSCASSWSIAQSVVAMTFRPGSFVRSDRLALTLLVTNPVAALDNLLHGPHALRGWGAGSTPDPALLVPRAFDATRRVFVYDTRPQFGVSSRQHAYLFNPFRVAIDARLAFGPALPDEWLRLLVKSLRTERGSPSAADFLEELVSNAENYGGTEGLLLLRLQTPLRLTVSQGDTLRVIEQERRTFRRAVYAPVAQGLAAGTPAVGSSAFRALYQGAVRQSLQYSSGARARIRAHLTEEQRTWLRTQRIAMQLFTSREDLDRAIGSRQVLPR